MPLPQLSINLINDIYGLPNEGNLTYKYSPFRNLQNKDSETGYPDTTKAPLLDLTLPVEKAEINITEPVHIEIEPSYDGSVNLIVNDAANPVKIINSRFRQLSTTTYKVAEREGNIDTNIYSEPDFKTDAGLVKTSRTITKVEYLGLSEGGNNAVGNYTFYFKFSDADGNETDFVSETGKIVCHIGTVNSPKSIRGGFLDENSYKIIKLKLKNIDLSYDYINIYYTRSTGSEDQEIVKAYKVTDKIKITGNEVEISFTGFENQELISLEELNVAYTTFDAVKTLANCQNMTFAANVKKNYELFTTLKKLSLFITPEIYQENNGIGNLDGNYQERYDIKNGFEYYNTKNIYYKLSYWDQEIYRFGIVYILPDYTLSPVFDIRGIKELGISTSFTKFNLTDSLEYNSDYLLKNSLDPINQENVKGVFKLNMSGYNIFDQDTEVRPVSLRFNFNSSVVEGNYATSGLKDLTKGFFIVRQKRIPTILAQSIGIATSTKAKIPVILAVNGLKGINYNYIAESFLTNREGDTDPILGSSLIKVTDVTHNALLCPEATLRTSLYNSFFNSSEFKLKSYNYRPSNTAFVSYGNSKNYVADKLVPLPNLPSDIETELTLVEPGIELIRNSNGEFRSKAGDSLVAYKHVDPLLGDFEDFENSEPNEDDYNNGISKVRGEFSTFIGTSSQEVIHGQYYNIYQKGYNFEDNWKEYFKIRYNDGTPYSPICDRHTWEDFMSSIEQDVWGTLNVTYPFYRGDCYINTYTQRINWNFIDPEMPTNKRVINPYTWAANFKVKTKSVVKVNNDGSPGTFNLTYNKLLPIFTYRQVFIPEYAGESPVEADEDDAVLMGIKEPEDKKFKKYSEKNGIFGYEKIQRPDVNAVDLGFWVTFKVCSNINLAMRDLDFSRAEEESIFKQKRGFFPIQEMDSSNPLPESNVINLGISKTTNDKYYFSIPDVPFIQTDFNNRIHYSNPLINSTFANGNRVFQSKNFIDYSKEYGEIVKILNWYERLLVVCEHGVFLLPVNERAILANESGENIGINSEEVLPKKPTELTNSYGSLWPESIVKTPSYVYGIDTVAKKIWRTNGTNFEIISDFVIQKFLNNNIQLFESDKDRTVGISFVKSHYNAFKSDILFTFKYQNIDWNLCWNELLGKWVTQYSWLPEFSENINNIFYTFANQDRHTLASNQLFKHGFSGTADETGEILATTWYDEKFPFEFEFIVNEVPGIQKIFQNLSIVSNKTEPDSFYFEVVGEAYDWADYKNLIFELNDTTLATVNGVDMSAIPTAHTEENIRLRYKEYLTSTPTVKKLPYIIIQSFNDNDVDYFYRNRTPLGTVFNAAEARDITLRNYSKTSEKLVNIYQKNATIKKHGRLRGNSQYLEDCWRIQIQSPVVTFVYLEDEILTYVQKGSELRDKYLKVRVKYTGNDYAIITAIKTIFNISYA